MSPTQECPKAAGDPGGTRSPWAGELGEMGLGSANGSCWVGKDISSAVNTAGCWHGSGGSRRAGKPTRSSHPHRDPGVRRGKG